jgi:hypothetical protein
MTIKVDNDLPLIGVQEIAETLNVFPSKIAELKHRNKLPEQDGTISGRPVWYHDTINNWIVENKTLINKIGGRYIE